MPYFLCRLANEGGRLFSRSVLTSSAEECRKLFESEGLCVLSVRKDWSKISLPAFPFEKRIRDKDFIMFNQELIALLKAGYPVLKSVEIISSRLKNVHLKELLTKVEKDIRGGKSLSEAFLPYEKNFSKVYTASLLAGEQSGNLPGSIGRFVNYFKVIVQTKSRIRRALLYPSLLIIFSFVLMMILLAFVLPRFSSFYADFEAELPAVTKGLMSVSLFLQDAAPFLGIGFIVLLGAFFRWRKKEKTGVILDRMKLKIPYGRTVWLETGISLFSRTLSLLLEAGISLLSAIVTATQAVPNKFLVLKMKNLADQVRNGESLSESLAKSGFFTALSLDMVRIGETSANLDGMLREVADVYDERVQTKIDTFVSLIEPVIIIFMGLLVAAMLLSVYLPIFNIIQVTR